MDCVNFLVKYILFIENFLVTVIGLVMIGLGSMLIFYRNRLNDILPDTMLTESVPITIVGCIIFIIAIIGCSAAIGELPYLLNIYGALLLILSAFKMYVVVKVYKEIYNMEASLTERLYRVFSDPEARKAFFLFEVLFKCCGPTSAESYKWLDLTIPPNCCPAFDVPSITSIEDVYLVQDMILSYNGTELCTYKDAYGGCVGQALESVYMFSHAVANSCLVASIIELIALVFAFYLAQHYRNEKEDVPRRRNRINAQIMA